MAYKKRTPAKSRGIKSGRGKSKKNSGHPFLLLLFFLVVVSIAAFTVNHPFSETVYDVSASTTTHQGDKKNKPLVPDENTKGSAREENSVIDKIINTITGKQKALGTFKKIEEKDGEIRDKQEGSVKNNPALKKKEPAYGKGSTEKANSVTGRLAVVIDDAGLDLESQRVYQNIGVPFTLAVMPNKRYTSEAATEWSNHGLPVILHQPMEPVSGAGMEDKTILTSMSDDEIRDMLRESLAQLPQAIGINNHQGSKATIDYRVMSVVMGELSNRGLFFFDSHTNTITEADKAALAFGVPYARNDLFVDNSSDEADIRAMIREGAERAKKRGSYIIIGHCRPHTAAAFREMVPILQAEGIEFIYVSSLLH